MIKRWISTTFGVMFLAGSVLAGDAQSKPALDGYCPVCLVKMHKLVKGSPRISSSYDGKTYLFPEAKQKKMFEANPAAFVPALGGDCTVCKVEKGKKVAGSPRFHSTYNGRLYLFPSKKQQSMFEKNPTRYADADVAMYGNCPVCKVEMGKDVKGAPEFAADYQGKRYLFPGLKQLDMFRKNPEKYAVK